LAASDFLLFQQRIEGQNLQGIKKGTSAAESLTISFYVKSSNTGTYICEFRDNDNTRQISKSYAINTANTWEKKTITVPPDTTGQFDNDNDISLQLFFWLAAGTTWSSGTLNDSAWASSVNANRAVGQLNLANATGNYWAVTGIQLERGSSATPYEWMDYGRELAMCQRYYYKTATVSAGVIVVSAFADSTTSFGGFGSFPVRLRATPTALSQSGTASDYNWNGTSSVACSVVPAFSSRTTTDMWQVNFTVASGLTAGHGGSAVTVSGNGYLAWSAEL
jgi:hypothetical protein